MNTILCNAADEGGGDQIVSVQIDDEESTLQFIDLPATDEV